MDLFNMFGGYQNFQQKFNQFVANFNRQSQLTPQQRVQQLLDSGQMSQEQFNHLSQMANMITGTKKF